jgi:hypothetical protein
MMGLYLIGQGHYVCGVVCLIMVLWALLTVRV